MHLLQHLLLVSERVYPQHRAEPEDRRQPTEEGLDLNGQRRWNWRLLEAAGSSTRGNGWELSEPASPWEYRAAQSRQARLEEAQEPKWGAAKGPL